MSRTSTDRQLTPAPATDAILQYACFWDHIVAGPNGQSLNCFGGILDVDELLSIFANEDLQIKDEYGQEALEACAQLERAKITQEEFLDVMKEYCSWTKSAAVAVAVSADVIPVIGGMFGLWKALVKTSNAIKDRSKAAQDKVKIAELQARYLRGLSAADGLAIETTKIAAVVQEMISRGFDDYETVSLNASSSATIQLLREEYLPYMRRLYVNNSSRVNTLELREKRHELKSRLIRQYEIVSVHLNRVEQGLLEMRAGNAMYFLKTNRLPTLAREYLLEVHLRAWYTLMGLLQAENTMDDQDEYNVATAVCERVSKIQALFENYAKTRLCLLRTRYDSKHQGRGSSKRDYVVWITDHGAQHDTLLPKLDLELFVLSTFPQMRPPEGGSIDFHPDGSCEIWNNTIFSREDRSSVLGQGIDRAIRDHISKQLQLYGPVWNLNLGFIDKLQPRSQTIEASSASDDRPPLPARRVPLQVEHGMRQLATWRP